MRFRSARRNPAVPAPNSAEIVERFGRYAEDDKVFDAAYRFAVTSGAREKAGDYAKRVLKAVHASRKAAARASLRSPLKYTRKMASEFWYNESMRAGDEDVWAFAFDEADAAGLSETAARKHAAAALSVVRAHEKAKTARKRAVSVKDAKKKVPARLRSTAKTNPRHKKHPFYVVRKSDGAVFSGWDYREDAVEAYRHPGDWDARTSRDDSAVMTHDGVKRKYGQVVWASSKAKANGLSQRQHWLTQSRIPWAKFSKAEIRAIRDEARMQGDHALAQKAENSLKRR